MTRTGLEQTAFIVALAAIALFGFGLGRRCRIALVSPPASVSTAKSGNTGAARPGKPLVPGFNAAVAAADTGDERLLHLAQAAAPLNKEQLAAALENERMRLMRTHSLDPLPAQTLLARYATVDPAAAATWVMRINASLWIQPQWLKVTLGAWAAKDPAAAWAWSQSPSQRQSDIYQDIRYDVFDALAFVNPRLALEKLIPEGENHPGLLDAVFAKAAIQDLPLARARALQLPHGSAEMALPAVIRIGVRRGDPAGTYTWVSQIASSALRKDAVHEVYIAWGERDPAAAAAWMEARGGPDLTPFAHELANKWAETDPEAAVSWCEHLPEGMRAAVLSGAIRAWAEHDSPAASNYAATLPQTYPNSLFAIAVGPWVDADPTAVLAWAETLPAGERRAYARNKVFAKWADHDPRACLESLSRQPDRDTLGDAWLSAVSKWAREDPMQLWNWSQTLADPNQREKAAWVAFDHTCRTDPVEASRLLGQLPAKSQQYAAASVAKAWSTQDPSAAAQWAGALADAKTRTAAFESLVEGWASRDAPAAAAWIDTQPTGEVTDAEIASLLKQSGNQLPPAKAIEMAQRVQTGGLRSNAMWAAAANWLKQDRTAAAAWINSNNEFPSEERARLLRLTDDAESSE